jgi:hypothetical protein
MQAGGYFEMQVDLNESTWTHISEDGDIQNYCYENFQSFK